MTEYLPCYEEILYPLQNKVLKILKDCALPFYLAGETAVSMGYFNHRYSDDLDLFANKDADFAEHVTQVIMALENAGHTIELAKNRSDFYTRVFIDKN